MSGADLEPSGEAAGEAWIQVEDGTSPRENRKSGLVWAGRCPLVLRAHASHNPRLTAWADSTPSIPASPFISFPPRHGRPGACAATAGAGRSEGRGCDGRHAVFFPGAPLQVLPLRLAARPQLRLRASRSAPSLLPFLPPLALSFLRFLARRLLPPSLPCPSHHFLLPPLLSLHPSLSPRASARAGYAQVLASCAGDAASRKTAITVALIWCLLASTLLAFLKRLPPNSPRYGGARVLRTATADFVLMCDAHVVGHAAISAVAFTSLGFFTESVRQPLFPGVEPLWFLAAQYVLLLFACLLTLVVVDATPGLTTIPFPFPLALPASPPRNHACVHACPGHRACLPSRLPAFPRSTDLRSSGGSALFAASAAAAAGGKSGEQAGGATPRRTPSCTPYLLQLAREAGAPVAPMTPDALLPAEAAQPGRGERVKEATDEVGRNEGAGIEDEQRSVGAVRPAAGEPGGRQERGAEDTVAPGGDKSAEGAGDVGRGEMAEPEGSAEKQEAERNEQDVRGCSEGREMERAGRAEAEARRDAGTEAAETTKEVDEGTGVSSSTAVDASTATDASPACAALPSSASPVRVSTAPAAAAVAAAPARAAKAPVAAGSRAGNSSGGGGAAKAGGGGAWAKASGRRELWGSATAKAGAGGAAEPGKRNSKAGAERGARGGGTGGRTTGGRRERRAADEGEGEGGDPRAAEGKEGCIAEIKVEQHGVEAEEERAREEAADEGCSPGEGERVATAEGLEGEEAEGAAGREEAEEGAAGGKEVAQEGEKGEEAEDGAGSGEGTEEEGQEVREEMTRRLVVARFHSLVSHVKTAAAALLHAHAAEGRASPPSTGSPPECGTGEGGGGERERAEAEYEGAVQQVGRMVGAMGGMGLQDHVTAWLACDAHLPALLSASRPIPLSPSPSHSPALPSPHPSPACSPYLASPASTSPFPPPLAAFIPPVLLPALRLLPSLPPSSPTRLLFLRLWLPPLACVPPTPEVRAALGEVVEAMGKEERTEVDKMVGQVMRAWGMAESREQVGRDEPSSSLDRPRPTLPRVVVPTFPERNRPQGQQKRNADADPPSPRHRMTKRQRKGITAKEKLHWLKMPDSQPDLSNRALAKLAKVQPCQIRDWKKMRERLEVSSSCRRRLMGAGRKSKFPFMERAVYRQFLKHRGRGLAVSGEVEVLDDVNDLVDDELVVNPFYAEVPMPAEVLQAAAEEADAAEEDAEAAAAEEEGGVLEEGGEAEEPSDDEWTVVSGGEVGKARACGGCEALLSPWPFHPGSLHRMGPAPALHPPGQDTNAQHNAPLLPPRSDPHCPYAALPLSPHPSQCNRLRSYGQHPLQSLPRGVYEHMHLLLRPWGLPASTACLPTPTLAHLRAQAYTPSPSCAAACRAGRRCGW
ncbi:unnamed protein product [Closterium sp. Naga37s-1]|nr:unnamed protein product [Closterium sp. Naga37s-1]